MNDTELDELLDTWTAPAPPPSLRGRLQVSCASTRRPRTFARSLRLSLLVAATLGLAGFLLVVTQAIPQTIKLVSPQVRPPYTVDSEYVRYASDGARKLEMYATSFSHDGAEVLISRTLPGNPIGTAIARTFDVGLPNLLPRPNLTPEMAERLKAARANPNKIGLFTGCDRPTCWITQHYGFQGIGGVDSGCAQDIIGRETILSYATVATQRSLGDVKRMTLWMAPALGCFALRVTMEERQPNGTFRLVSGKQAVKVTWNP